MAPVGSHTPSVTPASHPHCPPPVRPPLHSSPTYRPPPASLETHTSTTAAGQGCREGRATPIPFGRQPADRRPRLDAGIFFLLGHALLRACESVGESVEGSRRQRTGHWRIQEGGEATPVGIVRGLCRRIWACGWAGARVVCGHVHVVHGHAAFAHEVRACPHDHRNHARSIEAHDLNASQVEGVLEGFGKPEERRARVVTTTEVITAAV